MDLSKIKNLVKSSGDKFILVENGEPEIVVMAFNEYEKLLSGSARNSTVSSRPHDFEAAFADLEMERLREKEMEARAASDSSPLPVRLEDIRLEDLPI